jgi:hypothetical protein
LGRSIRGDGRRLERCPIQALTTRRGGVSLPPYDSLWLNEVQPDNTAGIADNFLKPLMLGRGVDAPMPVILLGALGGMAAAGILGLFVGAVLLALGYQIFMGWVRHGREQVELPPAR